MLKIYSLLFKVFYVLLFLIVIIAALFFIYFFIRNTELGENLLDLEDLGHLGSFFGGVLGSILTTITIILLIQSNLIQWQENSRLKIESDFNILKLSLYDTLTQIINDLTEYDLERLMDCSFFNELNDKVSLSKEEKDTYNLKLALRIPIFLKFQVLQVDISRFKLNSNYSDHQKLIIKRMLQNRNEFGNLINKLEYVKISAERCNENEIITGALKMNLEHFVIRNNELLNALKVI